MSASYSCDYPGCSQVNMNEGRDGGLPDGWIEIRGAVDDRWDRFERNRWFSWVRQWWTLYADRLSRKSVAGSRVPPDRLVLCQTHARALVQAIVEERL